MTISKHDVSYTKILQQLGLVILASVFAVLKVMENWDEGLSYALFESSGRKDYPAFMWIIFAILFGVGICIELFKIKKSQIKYKKYFDEEKYVSIKEMSLELHTDWHVVIKELENLVWNSVKRADIKNHTYIQFTKEKTFKNL